MDGVQKLIFCTCGFRDGFAHLFIGHLDVEYDGNMVFLHLIHEEGNSCRIGFRISGAAGESGVVGQAEFFGEIKEGETVTDDDFFSLRVINDVMEILIQFFQFRNVSLSVFLISLGIVLVETGNGFGEGFYDLDSVGGRGPDMLIHFRAFFAVMVVVLLVIMMMLFIMAVLVIVVMFFVFVMMMVLIFIMVIFVVVMVFMFFFLHAFRHFFFIQFDGIHHFECFQLALVYGA